MIQKIIGIRLSEFVQWTTSMNRIKKLIEKYLEQRKCSLPTIKGGIDRLVNKWERFTDELYVGKKFGLDDYLVFAQRRGILADIFDEVPESRTTNYFQKVTVIDEKFKLATVPITQCLWKAPEGTKHQEKYWFYYRKPKVYCKEDWPDSC
jgi:hypothetical protein